MAKLKYLIEIEHNEALLDCFVTAILAGECQISRHDPHPLRLATGEQFLRSSVIDYFLKTQTFALELYIEFFEQLRVFDQDHYEDGYLLGEWIEQVLNQKYIVAEDTDNQWGYPQNKPLKPDLVITEQDQPFLSFMCYVAICHMKYGASYASVTANEYFNIAEKLGSRRWAEIKQFGSGQIDPAITHIQDHDIQAQANDALATIAITANHHSLATYQKSLSFINRLLKTDFPKSFSINFQIAHPKVLAIEHLPDCGQQHLFAGAVQYPELHPLILEYIALSQHQHHWYSNLEGEDCAMPSTFAVFALCLVDQAYFPVLRSYLKNVDDGHQSIHQHFSLAFLQRYGVTADSAPLVMQLILSMQEHPPHPEFIQYFKTTAALNLLFVEKQHLQDDYRWGYVLYSLFGRKYESAQMQHHFEPEAWAIYSQLLDPLLD